MRLICSIDASIFRAVRAALAFLRDWGISQRQVERVLMVAMTWCILLAFGWLFALIVFAAALARHFRSDAARAAEIEDGFSRAVRVLSIPDCLAVTACHWLAPGRSDAACIGAMVTLSLFLYFTAIGEDKGERGKRAKIALAKLRELFPKWQPEPEAAPA